MQVVILCGGMGTRLREETEFRPKPMVPIGSRPILWHIMKGYAHHGFRQFLLALGYRGHDIKQYFLNYEAMSGDITVTLGRQRTLVHHDAHPEQGFEVTMAETGEKTMTGGRLLRMRRHVQGETFMLTYGDGVADVDIGALVAFHRSHGKIATLTTVRPVSRFGVVHLDPSGQVEGFHEKPAGDGWINAGFFVFDRRVFEYLDGDSCVLEQAPMRRLAEDGQLMAFRHDGFFFAMDTYREFQQLNQMWDRGEAPWRVWRE